MQKNTNRLLLYNKKLCLQVNMNIAAFACPAHPEVRSHNAGKCAKCGMPLIKKN